MNKAYLLSTGTALALGYAAGFASDDLLAQAATATSQDFVYTLDVSGQPKTDIETWVASNGCGLLNTELDLSGELACDATKDMKSVCVAAVKDSEGNRSLRASVIFTRAGTYTPIAPQ